MHILFLPISSRKEVARGTTEVSFGLGDKEFGFRAGQYVRISMPQLITEDPKGNYRDFSIASSPNEKAMLKIAIRNSESGFKKSLLESPLGTEVKVTGPFGNLALPESVETTIVFVAGGIGITPFLSMINYALEKKSERRMTLILNNKSREDAPYLKELETLTQENPNLSFKSIFGPVDEEYIKLSVPDLAAADWFIAGPPAMVVTVKKILINAGVPSKNIHTEEFLGYETGGSAYGLSAISRPREKLDDEALFSETLMRAVNEIALVSRTDTAGTILYVNDMFMKISKYSRKELIGQNHRVLKSGYHPQSFYNDIWQTISNGRVWRGEIKNRAKDGSYYWVDSVITPVLDKNRRIINYLAARLPITEKKEAEEKLAQEKAGIETMIASIGDGVVAIDRYWNITLWNRAATVITGWTKEEVLGKSFREFVKLIREYNRKENIAFIEETMLFGKPHPMENNTLLIKKDGGEIYIGDSASPIFNQKGQVDGAIVVFRDVSKEKELNKAREEFASIVNHQLRTPPTVIKGFLSLLFDETEERLAKTQKENLQAIEQANERMLTLVNALLNTSRVETGALAINPEPAHLPDLAEKALREFLPQIASKKLKLEKKFETNFPSVSVDPKLMHAVFQNLISNAVKYTPGGGTIVIAIEKRGQDVLLKISDTGMGIPKEQQSKMFMKMFRADNARAKDPDGAGLGLYIVRSIIEAAGGKIWFESPVRRSLGAGGEENKGTAFFITLPLSGMKKREGTKGLQ